MFGQVKAGQRHPTRPRRSSHRPNLMAKSDSQGPSRRPRSADVGRLRRGAVWSSRPNVSEVFVVVNDVDSEYLLEVAAADDEQVVKAVASNGTDPTLGAPASLSPPSSWPQRSFAAARPSWIHPDCIAPPSGWAPKTQVVGWKRPDSAVEVFCVTVPRVQVESSETHQRRLRPG